MLSEPGTLTTGLPSIAGHGFGMGFEDLCVESPAASRGSRYGCMIEIRTLRTTLGTLNPHLKT